MKNFLLNEINCLFLEVVKNSLELKRNVFLESEPRFRENIIRLMFDVKSFEEIATSIFTETIYPLIISNRFEQSKKIDIRHVLKLFPETRSLLKGINFTLQYGRAIDDLGVIFQETTDLSRFKISILINSICFAVNNEEFKSFRRLSKNENKKLSLGIIRVLVHELTHLIDYFRHPPETLLKDFENHYCLQREELRAITREFLFSFVKNKGRQLVLTSKSLDEFIEVVKCLNIWKTIIAPNLIPPNEVYFDDFLKNVYNYFKSGINEFGEKIEEQKDSPFLFYHVVRKNDIEDLSLSRETVEKIDNFIDDFYRKKK